MTLNDFEKINYIKNNFHQYFDLTLNTNITTTETVNLVIPIEDLTKGNTVHQNSYHHDVTYPEDYNIDDILKKYGNTNLKGEITCYCEEVIDGDTIKVTIPYLDKDNQVCYKKEKVRLVGINTPELNNNGFETSKTFLEKVCYSEDYYNEVSETNNKKIYLKVDSKKMFDNYKRLLAVLIVNNKNINEILLKEGLAEIMYIPPSEFNPFDWGDINTSVSVYNFQNDDINVLSPYFNSEMTNIVFTPSHDFETIYRYEIYKNIIYVRLKPFSQKITMHLLPKAYDCSDTVLIFKDSMIQDNNISMSADYNHYKNRDFINSYYQVNNEDRNRNDIPSNSRNYNVNDWTNTFCDFSYDISKSTKNFNNLEICSGYRYNNSTPYYSVHYTGVRDNTSIAIEDRCTLIDANYDNIENKSNNITQYHYDNSNQLYIPKDNRVIREKYEHNINHLEENENRRLSEKIYHKKIKYINDILYSEENGEYCWASWIDISREVENE